MLFRNGSYRILFVTSQPESYTVNLMAAAFDQGVRSALIRTMAGSAALVVAAGLAQARPLNVHIPTETVLYNFKGAPDAGYSLAGLTFDQKGALYGTTVKGGTADAGTVFKLTPPAAGQTQWAETVVYCFTDGDGNSPQAAGLIFDKKGVLYGTTIFGGISNLGTVFRLTPPAAGQTQWTEAVLYRFMGGADGTYPLASLIFDKKGALYGTTNLGGASNWGTVFKLTGINTELPKSRHSRRRDRDD